MSLRLQRAGERRLERREVGEPCGPSQVNRWQRHPAVGGGGQRLAVHLQPGQRHLLPAQCGGGGQMRVVAEQRRDRRRAPGHAKRAVRIKRGGVPLHRDTQGQCQPALQIGASGRRQRRKVRQCQRHAALQRPGGLRRAVCADKRMTEREPHRPVRRVQPCGSVQRQRSGCQQIGLRAGHPKPVGRGMKVHLSRIAAEIGGKMRNRSPGSVQLFDSHSPGGVRTGKRSMNARSHVH